MAKTEDKSNKLYGTGVNVTPITEGKINVGNKLATLNPNDPTALVDAFNIDWASGQYSYDGNPEHIIQSTGHLIEELRGKASTTSFEDLRDTVDSLQNRSADYYEQRWRVAEKTDTVDKPNNNDIFLDVEDDDWKLSPQYAAGKNTWMTARKVIYDPDDNYTKKYDPNSTWSDPMKMTGDDGASYPVHQVLLYKWLNSRTAPTINTNSSTHPSGWQESPGNTTSTNIYLWMIQGQRQNSNYIKWDTDGNASTAAAYWSAPICLSGPDGEPGKDGTDIEFIYKRFTNEHTFNVNDDDNPNHWSTSAGEGKITDNNYLDPQRDDYLGPKNYHWNDNPEGVSPSYPYEYCSIRYKTNGTWSAFISPFLWSKFGENGLDGDGVEYIYTTTVTSVSPTKPFVSESTFNNAQSESEWGVEQSNGNSSDNGDKIWHDDPQNVNNEYQKFQWVSTRKFKTITNNNYTSLINGEQSITIESSTGYLISGKTYLKDKNNKNLKIGDKAWFPYSDPELWNWYVNNGTNADRIVMVYKRSANNSSENAPTVSNNVTKIIEGSCNTSVNVSGTSGWFESPGNNSSQSENDDYLWMSSNYYSNVIHVTGKNAPNTYNYTVTDEWSTPICLTGEPGHEGEDGADIEFIYYRTADDNNVPTVPTKDDKFQNNDWPFVSGVTNYGVFNDGADDGISYVGILQNGKHADVWTDNPLGVTSTYDYEYAAVRRKPAGNNSEWGDFSKPFLWSKYGEDGVDGDGVEYIFYRSSNANEVIFSEENNNLPPAFDLDPNAFQKPEVYDGTVWHDDPQGVNKTNAWEYVSVRKFREITDSNLTDIPESFRNQVHVGDKIWFPYSAPALWSKYAFDAVASNLTIETDNDMMAVAIDGQNTTRNASSNSAQIFLYHNLSLCNGTNYDVKFITTNYPDCTISQDCKQITYSNTTVAQITQDSTTKIWKVTINIPENISLPQDGSFNFQIMAKVSNDTSIPAEIRDAERFYTFKVIGLSLSTIYQLKTDKIVIHRDVQNQLENVNVTMFNISDINDTFTIDDSLPENFYIFAKPMHVPTGSNTMITQVYDDKTYGNKLFSKNDNSFNIELYEAFDNIKGILTSVEFNLVYTSDTDDKQRIINSFTSSGNGSGLTPGVQPSESGTLITNGILVDRETVSVISDGKAGADSKSQEYIYFLCDEFDKSFTGDEDPETWSIKTNYQTDDYPFIGTDRANVLNNDWTDNPQGIDETNRYEYISSRIYDTSTETWGAFSKPVIWANWGHTGEDGDGVEYIYFIGDNSDWRTSLYNKGSQISNTSFYRYADPRRWMVSNITDEGSFLISVDNIQNYQATEYIPHGSNNKIGGTVGQKDYSMEQPWQDNPITNLPEGQYQFVSIRKYKTLTQELLNEWFGTNDNPSEKWKNIFGVTEKNNSNWSRETILNYLSSYTGKKIWLPYSEPALWGSNIKGADGINGSSGITLDFDNPSMQIAVNSNGFIKDNQSVTSYLNVYDGTTLIDPKYIGLSIDDTTPSAFKQVYNNTKKFGYVLYNNTNNNNNCTYYTWKISDIDTNNDGEISSSESSNYSNLKLEDNKKIKFKVSYNNIDYYKNVNLVPIQYGNDGADAETFELFCPSSVIHYNRTNSTFEPSSVQYQIKHVVGNNGPEFLNIENNTYDLSLYYSLIYAEDPAQPAEEDPETQDETGDTEYDDPDPIEGTNTAGNTREDTSENSSTVRGGETTINDGPTSELSGGAQGSEQMGEATHGTGTASGTNYTGGGQLYTVDTNTFTKSTNGIITIHLNASNATGIKVILIHTNSNNTTELWDSDILEIVYDGVNGNDGSDAIVLDWTNDQINLAVDGNGKIYNGVPQYKSTTLKLLNSSNDLTITDLNCYGDNNYFEINLTNSAGGEGDTVEVNNKINIYSSYSESDKDFTINISIASNFNKDITIPENGLEVTFTVTLSDYTTTISKVLKICGQHNGQNAVTYEIVPSANAIYRNNESYTPNKISYVVNKYDGTSVSKVSTFSDSFYAIWKPEGADNSSSIGTSIFDISASSDIGISNISYINLELMSNNIVIDRETIPIIDKGEKGSQGFTGPIVRYCGEWKSNSNGPSKYYNGLVKANETSVPNVYYKDIVYHDGKYYTPNASSTYDTTGEFTNIGYISNGSEWDSSKWKEATQFDFVATKLLYADQALIKQITSHDFIATKNDGTPVAGMTSGSKKYKNSEVSDTNYSGLHSSTFNKNLDTGGTGEDPSNVRMFAGQIWKNNGSTTSYSLTYAPFNVRQDGTAYMTNAHVTGDITANTLTLGDGSFKHITSTTPDTIILPKLTNSSQTKNYYILCDVDNKVIKSYSNNNIRMQIGEVEGTGAIMQFTSKANRLYQCISVGTTWNIVVTKVSEGGGSEYKYIDVTNDVQLFGYKVKNSNILISTYDKNEEDVSAWGPLMTDNGNDGMTIEFYTFLDPENYGENSSEYAIADFSNFVWLYQS